MTPQFITQAVVFLGLALVLGTLLIGVEIGIDFLLIGSILVISGLIGLWTGNLTVMLVIATILAVVYVLYGRSVIKQKLIFRTQSTNIDKLIGSTGTVISPIADSEYGIVKLGDEEWRAHAESALKKGEKVQVVAVEGVTLEVVKQ